MQAKHEIERQLENFEENQLIFASRLYRQSLSDTVSESAYYKTLERMCQQNTLAHVSRGIYCKPARGKYGIRLPSERDVIHEFTRDGNGTVIGYALYNHLNLTTQVPKLIEVYSSLPEQQTKRIGRVRLTQKELKYSPEAVRMIQILEVLKNYSEIQDLNQRQFIKLCEEFAPHYSDEVFEYVNSRIHYPKRAIAFLRSILDYYGVKNNLNKYLSAMSEYKYPKMEALHETT